MKIDILALTPIVNETYNSLKGLAKIKINNVLVISNIKILDIGKGKFLGFPQIKIGEEYKDIIEMSDEVRKEISNIVLEKFELKCQGEFMAKTPDEVKETENIDGINYAKNNIKVYMHKNKKENTSIKAFGSIVFEDKKICVNSMRLVEFKEKMFLAFPNHKKEDKYLDICYSASKDIYNELEKKAIESYNFILKNN